MLKGVGRMHSHIRFRRMKHGLILSLLAMLVAVALPGLAEAGGGVCSVDSAASSVSFLAFIELVGNEAMMYFWRSR